MKKELQVGFVQNAIQQDDLKKNAQTLLRSIQTTLKKSPELIMLPEIFLGGPSDPRDMSDYAKFYREFLFELQTLAKKYKTHFYGSVIEEKQKRFYNASVFVSPQKSQIVYRKNHLFHFDNEHKIYSASHEAHAFKAPWGKTAPQICYDIRFPELLRKMVFEGAEIALICAQWPDSRREHWLSLLRARAIENQMYVIACNRTGQKRNLLYKGFSCVITPWGDFAYMLKHPKKTGICKIDLSLTQSVRKQYPFLKDAYHQRIRFDISPR